MLVEQGFDPNGVYMQSLDEQIAESMGIADAMLDALVAADRNPIHLQYLLELTGPGIPVQGPRGFTAEEEDANLGLPSAGDVFGDLLDRVSYVDPSDR